MEKDNLLSRFTIHHLPFTIHGQKIMSNAYQIGLAGKNPAPMTAAQRARQIEIEHNLEELGRWMDARFRLPFVNWRFGLNAIFDLVPGIGDFTTTGIALFLLGAAVRYRVPKITLLRMGINIVIYFLLGLTPFLGDLLGAWWKPNMRNLRLLKLRATATPEEARGGRTSDWVFVAFIAIAILSLLALSFAFVLYVIYLLFHIRISMPF
jgi:hypothetical protein